MNASATPTREALATSFRLQARGCAQTGSPIYAGLLTRAAPALAAHYPSAGTSTPRAPGARMHWHGAWVRWSG